MADEISKIVKILLVGENKKDFLRMQKFTADRYQNLDMFLNDLSIVIKSTEVSCKVKYNLLSGKNTGILTDYKNSSENISVFLFVVGDGNMAEKLRDNFPKSDVELLMETNNKDLKILMHMLNDKKMFCS